ncbi:MAG TPA: DNA translocase FtsK [Paludibacteraceae bacterium]|nr:DNA translocase FtsK [Paludibacteraceae bacterium]HRS67775.1 DNA translocase FtsK [Paludibacteraceae bacterium]
MAKKESTTSTSSGFFTSLKAFIMDERTCFAFGLVLLLFTLYLLLSMVSFFFTGDVDQSIVNASWFELGEYSKDIQNWTGARGAFLAEILINRWFGLASFAILWFGFVVALRLMKVKIMALWKAFLFSALFLIWFSLFFAFFFSPFFENSFINLGGEHGTYLNEFLKANIGIPGTFFLLLGTGLLFAIFAFSQTVPFLRGLFRRKPKTNLNLTEMATDVDVEVEAVDLESLADQTEAEAVPSDWVIMDVDEAEVEVENDLETDKEEIPVENLDIDTNTDGVETETVDATQNEDFADYDPLAVQGPYDPKADLQEYKYPTLDLLKDYGTPTETVTKEEQIANQQRIITTLKHYGIGIKKIYETIGPTITLYEIVPEDGIRISKIRNLEPDIMLSLAATGIRIIAPIPGKGTIGIEVPNSHPRIVSMYATIGSKKFQESTFDLPIALGRTITNEVFMFDLCKMPHVLVAGATGQGKSVGLNAMITSLLYKKHPSELKFVLVDPKKVEFNIYSDIERHFLAKLPEGDEPVITDTSKVIQTLNSLCKEMDQRYDLLKIAHVRNIKEYNERFINRKLNPHKGHKYLPYIVVIVDEFGDLIMTAGKEIEMPIARIAQLARAVGIHMILATQRPSVNIITGVIKANFPARIAFKVSAMVDSKTILDTSGAQQLIGKGDLLFSQGNEAIRVQCAFVDTPEVDRLVHFISEQRGYPTAFELPEPDVTEGEGDTLSTDMSRRDEKFEEAARFVVATQQGSVSMLQRKFEIGFNRAARIMDQLEAVGVVGAASGSKPRQVLIHTEYELDQILQSF